MTILTEQPTVRPARLDHEPALDGLRGLAVLAVVVYHSGLGWVPGGFLGVSTFFTLSGFLITSLLLAEHRRDHTISLRSFWARRLRRLLPASLVCIAAIAVAAIWLGDSTQLVRLRGDGLSSVADVANWRFILTGDSYGAGFESPSPYTHFWSLAIEEQCYVLLPLLVAGVLLVARGSRRALAAVLGTLVAVSLAVSVYLETSGARTDRMYFGTEVRSAELLVGALLAMWWMRRSDPLGPVARRRIDLAAPVAGAAVLASWVLVHVQDRALFRGGLFVYSGLTVLIILGCMGGQGPLARVARWRPLVWVGTISYAVYLLHYPVLLWFGQHSPLAPGVRLLIALPPILLVAHVSLRWFEGPIRRGALRGRVRRTGLLAAAAWLATVGVVVAASAVARPAEAVDLEAVDQYQRYLEQSAAQQRSDAPRIGFFGDSSALLTSMGMSNLSLNEPDQMVSTTGWTELGCGILAGGDRVTRGQRVPIPEECRNWEQQWADSSAEQPSDLAVVQLGPWEMDDQQLTPDGPLLHIGDPDFDRVLSDQLRRAVEVLLVDNARVVFLEPPDLDVGRIDGRPPAQPAAESDPERMARFRAMLGEVADEDPRVDVLALEDWYSVGAEQDREMRPDGIHLSESASNQVAPTLRRQLLAIHRRATGSTTSTVHTG